MSKLSIIVPVYWNSDTLMLLYQDMKEKNINACLGLIRKHVYPFRIEYSDDMLVEKFHYIK